MSNITLDFSNNLFIRTEFKMYLCRNATTHWRLALELKQLDWGILLRIYKSSIIIILQEVALKGSCMTSMSRYMLHRIAVCSCISRHTHTLMIVFKHVREILPLVNLLVCEFFLATNYTFPHIPQPPYTPRLWTQWSYSSVRAVFHPVEWILPQKFWKLIIAVGYRRYCGPQLMEKSVWCADNLFWGFQWYFLAVQSTPPHVIHPS